ncbi:MAG: ring-cleaving dioxygenase [Gemmobacter sp.]
MTTIPGLHHVTAISGDAQANVDFVTRTLGQRLIKKTVNFDAPDTYHLYYGDAAGRPGSVLTFFPFADAGPGRAGPGMAEAVAYAVPDLDAVTDRVRTAIVAKDERFGAKVVTLTAPDGLVVDLIETPAAPDNHAFHSVTLNLRDPGPTAALLTGVMGYAETGHETVAGGERLRLVAPGGAEASVIDLVRRDRAAPARPGAGTIHHVAFRAPTAEAQRDWQERLAAAGHPTTPVIDRQYFNAIYFREPGGVLFEIATDAPGFTVDEDPALLGQALKLPPKYEGIRDRIERSLPVLTVPA